MGSYKPIMILSDISTKISELTQSDTNLYPNANRLININAWYRNVQTEILRSQDDWDFDDSNTTDYPILSTNLTAGQQTYILPTNTIEVKRIEITYDSVNWHKMREMDIGERLEASNSTSLSDFSTSAPYYSLEYGSIFLFPIPTANVTLGLRIWISRLVTEFTSAQLVTGTLEPGFDALFHDILAYGASFEWLVAKNLMDRTKNVKQLLDEKVLSLRNHFGRKTKDEELSLNIYPISYK